MREKGNGTRETKKGYFALEGQRTSFGYRGDRHDPWEMTVYEGKRGTPY